ncbi:MAG: hypothetical protein ACLQNV_01290 [Steroidobacteraceae bacterium]
MTDFASSQPYTEAEREADKAPRRSAFERFRRKAKAVRKIRHYLRVPTPGELALTRRMLGEHNEA